MDAWEVWLVALGVVVAGAAAVFAWVQARAAVESLRDARTARDEAKTSALESARLAGEANAAFVRQAEAQEEANRLKVQEMTPNDWTGPEHVRGELRRLTNTSRGPLYVTAIDIEPENMAGLVHIQGNRLGLYEYGDALEYIAVRTMGGSADKMTISYTPHGSNQSRTLIVRL